MTPFPLIFFQLQCKSSPNALSVSLPRSSSHRVGTCAPSFCSICPPFLPVNHRRDPFLLFPLFPPPRPPPLFLSAGFLRIDLPPLFPESVSLLGRIIRQASPSSQRTTNDPPTVPFRRLPAPLPFSYFFQSASFPPSSCSLKLTLPLLGRCSATPPPWEGTLRYIPPVTPHFPLTSPFIPPPSVHP